MAMVEIQCCKVIDAGTKQHPTPNGFAAACSGLSTRFADEPDGHDGNPSWLTVCVHVGAMRSVTDRDNDQMISGGKRWLD